MLLYLNQKNYDDALIEIQSILLKGVSLNELQTSSRATTNNVVVIKNKEQSIERSGSYSANNVVSTKKEEQSIQRSGLYSANNNIVGVKKEEQPIQTSYSLRRRHDVQKWLHKCSQDEGKKPTSSFSLINVVENSVGGENVILRQSYHACNYEIVVSYAFLLSFIP